MYARGQQRMHRPAVVGGEPITPERAVALRTVVFGTCATPSKGEWLRTGLVFREPGKDLSYGLKAPRNGTRGLLSAVQAYVIKYLLFDDNCSSDKLSSSSQYLKPSKEKQREVLELALVDILWKIGEGKKAVVCLPQEKSYVPHSLAYFQDSLTEKLHFFEVNNEEELKMLIKRYSYLFQDEPGPGALLLLYSAVITRGISRIISDFSDDKFHLVTTAEEGTHCIVLLLLIGRATPFLHNGIVYVGDEEHYANPHFGILSRSEIGFLMYEENINDSSPPGSRLKTPTLPIWVVFCQGHFGIVFNTNKELLRNYHAERRFDLIYYTCGGNQCQLSVDSRNSFSTKQNTDESTSTLTANLEKLIHTKWPDAQIQWTGTTNVI